MSWTFFTCFFIAIAWMGLFYLWGKGFLTLIKAERDFAGNITFGYLVLQFSYQIIYLPFYFSRGSYRSLSFIWLGMITICSILLVLYLYKRPIAREYAFQRKERIGLCAAIIAVFFLAIYISLHVPYYGQDTRTYISAMNESFFRDTIWYKSERLSFHYGMSSMFQFFTVTSLLTGIKPYYVSLFTVRIIGTCLLALVAYRTGIIIFQKERKEYCWSAVIMAVLVPFLLMFWGSIYTAEFFYWRIYEAKGYCQFILLPLGFSVFLSMYKKDADRKVLWKEQFLVGLAAVSVSASSLTSYMFLSFLALLSLLAYDKFKNGLVTVGHSFLCVLPNLIYLVMYIFEKKGIIVL